MKEMLAEILEVERRVLVAASDTCDNPIHFNFLWHRAQSGSFYCGTGFAAPSNVVSNQVEMIDRATGQVSQSVG